MFSLFLYLTFYIQNQLGYTALESGIRFLPTTLVSFAVAPLSGKLAERFGVRWFLGGGLALVGIGLLLMHGLEPGDDWTALLPGMLVAGAGIGLTNPALATAAVGVVDARRSGMASGINSTFRQVGVATGIAGWGALFQHFINQRADDFARALAAAGVDAQRPADAAGSFADFISFGIYRSLGPQAIAPGRDAFLHGLNPILTYAALLAFAGAVLSVLLVRPRDFVAHGQAGADVPAAA
jgi:MFS family permease